MLSRQQQLLAADAYVRRRSPAFEAAFEDRLRTVFPSLCGLFAELYGERDDCLDRLADLVGLAERSWTERAPDLKALDAAREADPRWFQSNRALGGVCYVDRYAGDLAGVRARVPYFKELGLTFLHLMPPFLRPEASSDGGYAVSSYREVDPALGTVAELRDLAAELRGEGISLVLDFVFNHTSDEHAWARAAAAGDPGFAGFYRIFPDRTMPDAYERTTREIFPDDHPGSFVQIPDGRWVWATFHRFQWDLDYANPAVFRAMAGEMLFLANLGVEVLRMDAVAFVWKRLGTACESLPQAHTLLRAFNAVCRLAAPSVLFLSEAIVHPDEVVAYLDPAECQLSYNPLLMALGWEALATRDVRLLRQAIDGRQNIDPRCAWVNYVRGHDDIGWTFADEDAGELGIVGHDHRRFLNSFYVGRFPGSFARGVPFQDNPRTGDCRVSGTTASLAGVEAGDPGGVERVLLLHALAFAAGGIPMLYLGDEVGQLNDHGYLDDPATAGDSRWVHRPRRPDALLARRHDPGSVPGRVFAGLRRLTALRRATPALAAGGRTEAVATGNRHVLGFRRTAVDGGSGLLVLANFADDPQTVAARHLAAAPPRARDLVAGGQHLLREDLSLRPRQFLWLPIG